jgi:hypothetical protein
MNNCYGCLKIDVDGYCPKCRKILFTGVNISSQLDFSYSSVPDIFPLKITSVQNKHL